MDVDSCGRSWLFICCFFPFISGFDLVVVHVVDFCMEFDKYSTTLFYANHLHNPKKNFLDWTYYSW